MFTLQTEAPLHSTHYASCVFLSWATSWFYSLDQWHYSKHSKIPPSPFQISQWLPVVPLRRRGHTGNSGGKIDRTGKKKPSRACYGVRVKRTRFSARLYQLNQYLWIEHSPVLQQVECRTANSSVAPLKIIPFLSLSAVYLNWVSSPFVRSPYHLEKVNPRVIFILIFALIVVFTLVVPDGFAQWYSGGVLWGNSWCKWG